MCSVCGVFCAWCVLHVCSASGAFCAWGVLHVGCSKGQSTCSPTDQMQRLRGAKKLPESIQPCRAVCKPGVPGDTPVRLLSDGRWHRGTWEAPVSAARRPAPTGASAGATPCPRAPLSSLGTAALRPWAPCPLCVGLSATGPSVSRRRFSRETEPIGRTYNRRRRFTVTGWLTAEEESQGPQPAARGAGKRMVGVPVRSPPAGGPRGAGAQLQGEGGHIAPGAPGARPGSRWPVSFHRSSALCSVQAFNGLGEAHPSESNVLLSPLLHGSSSNSPQTLRITSEQMSGPRGPPSRHQIHHHTCPPHGVCHFMSLSSLLICLGVCVCLPPETVISTSCC